MSDIRLYQVISDDVSIRAAASGDGVVIRQGEDMVLLSVEEADKLTLAIRALVVEQLRLPMRLPRMRATRTVCVRCDGVEELNTCSCEDGGDFENK